MLKGIEYLATLPEWSGSGTFSLEAIKAVMSELGDPQERVPCIHIAGTNGKGSVSVALASILGAKGYSVGLTTSPHLFTVEERIVLDGNPIATEILNSYLVRVIGAASNCRVTLSYFEAVCAAAFLYFYDRKVDWMVIETGLGGRLDATNIVKSPKATVITSIDLDHEHILGDTLEKIAREKAGILKAGVPAVIGPMQEEARRAIEEISAKQNAPLHVFGRDFTASALGSIHDDGRQEFVFDGSRFKNTRYAPALRGSHQGNNMALCLRVAELLGVEEKVAVEGVETVFWPGRLESMDFEGKKFIIDSGHNPAGIETLISYLKSRELKNLSVGFGALETKNWRAMVAKLIPFADFWSILRPDSIKAVPAEEIAEYLSSNGVKNVRLFDSRYGEFLDGEFKGSNITLLAGSIYLVGKLRKLLNAPISALWHKK